MAAVASAQCAGRGLARNEAFQAALDAVDAAADAQTTVVALDRARGLLREFQGAAAEAAAAVARGEGEALPCGARLVDGLIVAASPKPQAEAALHGYAELHRASQRGSRRLRIPLFALVGGVTVAAPLPISPDSVVLGGTPYVRALPEAAEAAQEVAAELDLSPSLPASVTLHLGGDERIYAVDPAGLFPPDRDLSREEEEAAAAMLQPWPVDGVGGAPGEFTGDITWLLRTWDLSPDSAPRVAARLTRLLDAEGGAEESKVSDSDLVCVSCGGPVSVAALPSHARRHRGERAQYLLSSLAGREEPGVRSPDYVEHLLGCALYELAIQGDDDDVEEESGDLFALAAAQFEKAAHLSARNAHALQMWALTLSHLIPFGLVAPSQRPELAQRYVLASRVAPWLSAPWVNRSVLLRDADCAMIATTLLLAEGAEGAEGARFVDALEAWRLALGPVADGWALVPLSTTAKGTQGESRDELYLALLTLGGALPETQDAIAAAGSRDPAARVEGLRKSGLAEALCALPRPGLAAFFVLSCIARLLTSPTDVSWRFPAPTDRSQLVHALVLLGAGVACVGADAARLVVWGLRERGTRRLAIAAARRACPRNPDVLRALLPILLGPNAALATDVVQLVKQLVVSPSGVSLAIDAGLVTGLATLLRSATLTAARALSVVQTLARVAHWRSGPRGLESLAEQDLVGVALGLAGGRWGVAIEVGDAAPALLAKLCRASLALLIFLSRSPSSFLAVDEAGMEDLDTLLGVLHMPPVHEEMKMLVHVAVHAAGSSLSRSRSLDSLLAGATPERRLDLLQQLILIAQDPQAVPPMLRAGVVPLAASLLCDVSDPSDPSVGGGGDWQCQQCTVINAAAAQRCATCDADSPSVAAAVTSPLALLLVTALVACPAGAAACAPLAPQLLTLRALPAVAGVASSDEGREQLLACDLGLLHATTAPVADLAASVLALARVGQVPASLDLWQAQLAAGPADFVQAVGELLSSPSSPSSPCRSEAEINLLRDVAENVRGLVGLEVLLIAARRGLVVEAGLEGQARGAAERFLSSDDAPTAATAATLVAALVATPEGSAAESAAAAWQRVRSTTLSPAEWISAASVAPHVIRACVRGLTISARLQALAFDADVAAVARAARASTPASLARLTAEVDVSALVGECASCPASEHGLRVEFLS